MATIQQIHTILTKLLGMFTYYNVSNAFNIGKSVGHYMDHNTTQKQQIKWGKKQAYRTNFQVNEQNDLSFCQSR